MESIRELTREHEAIQSALERFARTLDAAELDGQIDAESVGRLLDFLERQVDGHHQEKEERALLRCLLERARGADLHGAQSTFREHVDERKLLALMRDNLDGACYGEPNCVAAVVRYARRYVATQREHIAWEQRVLFTMAERILGPDEDRDILQKFRELDDLWGCSVCDAATRLFAWLDQHRSPVLA
jgi:hemerythrin-like domain-containing protein